MSPPLRRRSPSTGCRPAFVLSSWPTAQCNDFSRLLVRYTLSLSEVLNENEYRNKMTSYRPIANTSQKDSRWFVTRKHSWQCVRRLR
jgi:hypothetical protein